MTVNTTENSGLIEIDTGFIEPEIETSSANSTQGCFQIHLPDTANTALQHVNQKIGEGWDAFLRWGRNVVHGDREKVQSEIVQIASGSKGKARKMLIIESDAIEKSHPDAFKQFPVRADISKFREMAKDNEIDYCPIQYRAGYVQDLRKRRRDGELYDEVRVRSHGNIEHVQLGKYTMTKNQPDNLKLLAERVKDGGIVIFEACKVGAGEDNLARTFSGLCPQATVYASDKFHDPIFGLSMENGTPSFKGGLLGIYGDSTRIYKNGELVTNTNSAVEVIV